MISLFKKRPPLQDLGQLSQIAIAPDAISILTQAAQYKAELLRLIAGAKRRIYLCSLYLQHDEAGQEILSALYAAKKLNPDLDIRIFVDWHRAQRGLIGEQKIPGKVAGNAAWYQAQSAEHDWAIPVLGVPVQTRELFGVLHLKGFVIDDTVLYSGASLNNVYLHQCDKYRHDRYWLLRSAGLADNLVQWMQTQLLSSNAVHRAVYRLDAVEIPKTRQLRSEIRAFRERLKSSEIPLSSDTIAQTQQLCVSHVIGVGNDTRNRLNRSLCQLLAAAQQQITICTPYFNFPLAITREINRALKRGVCVSVIVGDKTANDFYISPELPFKAIGSLPYLYEMNLRRFAKKHQAHIASGALRLHLWKDGDNSYHVKGMWIDDLYTLVTGNNLNPRAFRLDLENALLFTDPHGELLAQREAELRSIYTHTQVLQHYREIQRLQDYPPKVRQFLSRLSRVRLDRLAYRVL